MKKLILAAVAASVLATPAAAAPFGRNDNRGRVEQVQRNSRQAVRQNARQDARAIRQDARQDARSIRQDARQDARFYRQDARQDFRQAQRRWNRGERFDSRYATNYRVIGNPRAYRLNDAPYGYRWVQSGNDAVLVAVASGLIGAIIGNLF